jgi:phage terminase large subunit
MTEKLFVVNAREIQRSMKDSIKKLYEDQIGIAGLGQYFDIKRDSIVNLVTQSELIFVGLQDHTADSVKGLEGADILLMEEAQSLSQRSLDLAIPSIRKPGSEIWALWNPTLDSDAIQRLLVSLKRSAPDDLDEMNVGIYENPFASREALNECERLKSDDPVKWGHVYGGQTVRIVEGAIYEGELSRAIDERRITSAIHYQPDAQTILAFDLGRNDCTSVILGQHVGAKEKQIFWSYENNFQEFSHYVDIIRKLDHRIDSIILPHDAKAKTISTIDSPYETCKKAWPNAKITVLSADSIELGIEHARKNFGSIYIHPENAKSLYESLRRYRRKLLSMVGPAGEPTYGDPIHDQASHGADAFRYWMQVVPMVKVDISRLDSFNINHTNPFQRR